MAILFSKVAGTGAGGTIGPVLTKPNPFSRVYPAGTEIHLDPITGKYYPREIVRPEILPYDGVEHSPWPARSARAVITSDGKVLQFKPGTTISGGTTSWSIETYLYDPISKRTEDKGQTAVSTTTSFSISHTEVTQPYLVASDTWFFGLTGNLSPRVVKVIKMEYNPSTSAVTLTPAPNNLGNTPTTIEQGRLTTFIPDGAGEVWAITQGSSNIPHTERINIGTMATTVSSINTGFTGPNNTPGNLVDYGIAYNTSDGKVVLNIGTAMAMKSYSGSWVDAGTVDNQGATLSSGPIVPWGTDRWLGFYKGLDGVVQYQLMKYDVGTETLTVYPSVTTSIGTESQFAYSNNSNVVIVNNTLYATSGSSYMNNWFIMELDPVTEAPIVSKYQEYISEEQGMVLSASDHYFNQLSSDGLFFGAYQIGSINGTGSSDFPMVTNSLYTAGVLGNNTRSVPVGVLKEDSTTTEFNIWFNRDNLILGEDLVEGTQYGDVYAISTDNAVRIPDCLGIMQRFDTDENNYLHGPVSSNTSPELRAEYNVKNQYFLTEHRAIRGFTLDSSNEEYTGIISIGGTDGTLPSQVAAFVTLDGYPVVFSPFVLSKQNDDSGNATAILENAESVNAYFSTIDSQATSTGQIRYNFKES